jgi:hypothetical protein
MADIVLNDSLGRIAEIIQDGADLEFVVLSAVDADGTVKDGYGAGNPTLLSDFLGAAGNTEQTGSNWTRYAVANASVTLTIDDTADSVRISVADKTWTAIASTFNAVAIVMCLDGGGADTTLEVLTKHDFAVTADGNDVIADINPANGVWSSS